MARQSAPDAPPGRADGPDGRVTVAVITRDRPYSVLRTLDALATLPERPRVIVVDNGCDDAACGAVRRHPAAVRLLRPRENTGALGRNLAVQHADTPYVAFSDDDSWWAPGALRRAADHQCAGGQEAKAGVGVEHLPGRPVLGFLGCACVVRRDAFLTAGGYHPLLFFGGEETLLAYDLAVHGWGVTYEPSLTARHHPDPAGRGDRNHLQRRNEALTLWLRRPLPVALWASARLAAAAVTGESEARRALHGLLLRLPAALARRRPLPEHVEHAARLVDSGACASAEARRRS